jgi:putative addiction module component (TIGR02574 family)
MDKIREEILSLSACERASLAHDLILSLDKDDGLYFDEEYEAEIKRRVSMVKEGKAEGQSADEVFSEVERRYKK